MSQTDITFLSLVPENLLDAESRNRQLALHVLTDASLAVVPDVSVAAIAQSTVQCSGIEHKHFHCQSAIEPFQDFPRARFFLGVEHFFDLLHQSAMFTPRVIL